MLSVADASACVLEYAASLHPKPSTCSYTEQASTQVSLIPLCADRDFPPFDRVAMDGIAIAYASWEQGLRCFSLAGKQAAGVPPLNLSDQSCCIEVMTGAMLPRGCDSVIRYEDISLRDGHALVHEHLSVKKFQNIAFQGSDKKAGEVLCPAHTILQAPQWAAVASVGRETIEVVSPPRIAIIGTGDELVGLDCSPLPHQLRASNIYALAAALRDHGFSDISLSLVKDNMDTLTHSIRSALLQADVCLVTGGVSAGAYDYVPLAFKRCEVNEHFHKVAQRPGKPLWFGSFDKRCLVFGLPGNPLAALICTYRYVLPALFTITGRESKRFKPYAQLSSPLHSPRGETMTLFSPVAVRYGEDGIIRATPLTGINSGDIGTVLSSDGFVECPADFREKAAGEALRLFTWGAHYHA